MMNTQKKTVRLVANENFYGPPPKAIEAINRYSSIVNEYPDFVPNSLKQKLADKYSVSAANITVGAGTYELIDIIIKALVAKDGGILTFDKTFMAYAYQAELNNKKCVIAEMTSNVCDVDLLIPLCTESTGAIFFANPNNPTGTIITHDELKHLLNSVPEETLVVADESYFEYVTDESYANSLALLKEFPNLVILHTFSKIYGLAGMRVGYAISHEEISQRMEKHRLLRSVNVLAEKSAEAALDESEYIEWCASENAREREYLYTELFSLGYDVEQSHANFIYMPFEDDEYKEQVFNYLKNEGLLICNMSFFRQKNALRITVGDREVNQRVVSCLKDCSKENMSASSVT
ncbi:MAG: histidinol-phosphate transaminase [Candidatus Marinimicrobia bacterium]|jgi:histidinol-phosphate aminotransferase|nr:histidinol-phosphate transaminase [Candidatus Neomarinimicrobiota bacterium]MDP6593949.1 histidinol-phosphate transaminase [Candidatus Neomarinimicrobiota bacterium]MDP6836747.1 histidinol-phosphate transaminase [Candidatus Neomarinimicrobiota bacterium]|tara:strand:+ start:648 stop:1694 length:1047 start_codon:yes stop_codon:yes gene_type:complete